MSDDWYEGYKRIWDQGPIQEVEDIYFEEVEEDTE
jgi:hypothetical protein